MVGKANRILIYGVDASNTHIHGEIDKIESVQKRATLESQLVLRNYSMRKEYKTLFYILSRIEKNV